LPQLSLTGDAGTTALGFATLGVPGNVFWTIAGNVGQTIFDAGTLLHKQRAAEAALDAAEAQYRSTVITAFQNVADSLARARVGRRRVEGGGRRRGGREKRASTSRNGNCAQVPSIIWYCSRPKARISRRFSTWWWRGQAATPIPQRFFRHWAGAGGTAGMCVQGDSLYWSSVAVIRHIIVELIVDRIQRSTTIAP
jgi:Outer membrane efflux protein